MTATEAPSTGDVGRVRHRKEDARLVTGRARYTDDIQLPGMLHMAVLRSPMAHARVKRVDVSAALDQLGVVAAYSGSDLADELGSLPSAWPPTADMVHPDHPPLATDEVRHVGDAVAVVVARDRYTAADAVEAIDVDYEPLAAVIDLERALEDQELVHSEAGTNRCYTFAMAAGEVEQAFAEAEVTVTRRFVQQRLIPTAMEPRAVVADPVTSADELTLYTSTQVPHIARVMLAMTLGISEHELRVVAPDVGGGFGSKLNVYAEEAIALVVARRHGRPVEWTESRSENHQATTHGRAMLQDVEIAATSNGDVKALRVRLTADMGAYLQLLTPIIPILGAMMYPGIYRFGAYDFSCTGVFTTTTPTDAYRGAGRPEAAYAIERIMDELAAELGMDPIELRRRNWIGDDQFPFETIAGLVYDSGNYDAATDRALELFDVEGLRREQAERRERGDQVQLGIGTSTYTELCGVGPSRALGSLNHSAGGWESATVRLLPTGKVEVVTGTSPHGQGHVTAWSQIAADALGVPFEDVVVLHGDTRVAPMGLDTYGSRSLAVGGVALHMSCEKVVDKAKPFAAHLLEANVDDLEYVDGSFRVRGSPEAATTIQDVALAVFAGHDYPEGLELDLTANTVYDPENFTFPHGTQLCAVEVDTETGAVEIRSYVAVDDVGRVVNPQLVQGQVHGGIVQGIGQALFEEGVYDEDGNLVTSSLVSYNLPSAADLPDLVTDRTESPSPVNPLGAKGVGETGTIAATPAVMNAVVDALRHLGVRDVRMPASPANVWQAMQAARSGVGEGGAA